MNDQKNNVVEIKIAEFLNALKSADFTSMKTILWEDGFRCIEKDEEIVNNRDDFIKIFEHEFDNGLELYNIDYIDQDISILIPNQHIKITGKQIHDVKDPGKTREIQEFIFTYELKNLNDKWYIIKIIIDDIED
ncbi:nuclear transport factor 2 family protein [Halonatronum saccharophilum]|uniref:nuclear transport factor 2 family protein n=1 Tax=Halonatronum saccharophilum TaxID=150060 RepID=UPI000480E23D|nr:nuclear transport factor 2 family protein [Halonatronum saccharophilum]